MTVAQKQQSLGVTGLVARWTAGVALALVALTAADIWLTLHALELGHATEFNPNAADAEGGLRTDYLIALNGVFVLLLIAAFAWGLSTAHHMPRGIPIKWWRHLVDFIHFKHRRQRSRERSPLRFVALALMIVLLKSLIVISNFLVVLGLSNPVTSIGAGWGALGLRGGAQYWATYIMLVVPCYVTGVAWAASLLRRVHDETGVSG